MAESKDLKSILVDNKSAHDVILYILPNWFKFRSLSSSFIVKRDESYLFQRETSFQFELMARPKGEKRKTIWPARMWEKDLLLRVSGDHEIQVKNEDLEECKEKQICIRQQNMAKEVSVAGRKNLYEILKLDMKEVRGKPLEEQEKMIKRAYHSQLRRWHPDRNPENGDSVICQEIIAAYEILKDPEARAAYNNVADFDKGWLSMARLKAMFNPERYSDEQKRQYKKRMGLSLLSVILIVAGFGLTFATAGMAAPVAFGLTAGSGALMGGGISSALRTINCEAIEKGCSYRRFFTSLLIGAVGGAAMGVGVAGIAVVFGGAAKLALKAAQLSLERQISMRIATTAFRGFITSLTNRIEATLAGGQKTTMKKFILHVLFDAWLQGIAGLPGGFTENMVQNLVCAEEALTMLETVPCNARNVIEETTTITLETFANTVQERLDDDVENKPIMDHVKMGATRAAIAVGKRFAMVVKDAKKLVTRENTTGIDRQEEIVKTSEDNDSNGASLPPLPSYKFNNESALPCYESLNAEINDNDDSTESMEHRLHYISEGRWFSKMLVDYKENGKTEHYELEGSDSSIRIPNKATNIKVRFQVMRFLGIWCDVKKYDRFKKCWIKPNQPHTFEYDTPVSRRYTLTGNLYYEAVMKITEDYNNMNEI